MYFNSLTEILLMNGHGSYVWSCIIITLLVLGLNAVSAIRRHKKTLQTYQLDKKLSCTQPVKND